MSIVSNGFLDPNFITPIGQKQPVYSGRIHNGKFGYEDRPIYSFSDVFQNALQDVVDTEKDYVNKQYLLATGQIDNAADVTIAASKAQLAVDLLVQMRNSALTAYNEILRINV